jgi:hypothetical protein
MRFLFPTRKRFARLVLFLSLTGATAAVQATQQAGSSSEVPASVAAGHFVKQVDPEYPGLARALVNSRQYREAERVCKLGVELAEKITREPEPGTRISLPASRPCLVRSEEIC